MQGDFVRSQRFSKELELKLLISPQDQPRFLQSDLISRCVIGPGQEKRLHSVYYDTAEHTLAENGFSLRVRRDGDTFVQTLKFAPQEEKSFSRHEWETPLQGSAPELSDFPGSALGPVAARLRAKALVPLCSSTVRRRVIPIGFKESILELALDEGVIAAGERERPISELEIEVKKGDATRLYELALELLDLVPLRWSTESKFKRGFALAQGRPPSTAKASPSSLTEDMVFDDAVAAVLAGCQRHLLANEPAAEDGRDSEGVHQMRVAVRRMRAAFALFDNELETKAFKNYDRELKWLAHKLGACRDWDVFETETLAKAKIGDEERSILQGAAAPKRDEAYGALRKTFAQQRYVKFQLSLGHLIECHGWREAIGKSAHAQIARPSQKVAPSPLTTLLRKAWRKGRRFNKLSLRKRHRVRVALKKLRFASEFFEPIFGKRKVKRYEKQLALLQKLLGKDSDMITTAALLQELLEASPSRSLAHAAASLRKWQAKERRAAAPQARKAWVKLKAMQRFW